MTEITIKHLSDGWWVLNTGQGVEDMGPYRTKEEAHSDYRGVKRFMRSEYGIGWKLAQRGDERPREGGQGSLF